MVLFGAMQIRLNAANASAVKKLKRDHKSVLHKLSHSKIVNTFLTAARKAKISIKLT